MNPHYNPGKFLREWFPEQTKTIPRIILWTIVFLTDVGLVFWAALALGLPLTGLGYQLQKLVVPLLLVAALALFALEVWIYNRIAAAIRNKKEEPLL